MPSTLSQFRSRLAARLVDSGSSVFATATLDEALLSALSEYTAALPLTAETVLVLPGAGREIALAGISGLLSVTDAWWPYDSAAAPAAEQWPPNRVAGFRLWWDDAQPVLFLNTRAGAQPRAGDEIRVWYTKVQTIQDLAGADGVAAAITTVLAQHESGLVTGAAAYAAASEHLDQVGAVHIDPHEQPALQAWSSARYKEFQAFLSQVRNSAPSPGEPFGAGWALDRHDDRM